MILNIFLLLYFLEKDLQQRAFNLSLAALLGNEVYNFGELVIVGVFN